MEPVANAFDWPLAYEAEEALRAYLEAFRKRNPFARDLASRMRDETGTDFYEWVDHLTLEPTHAAELRDAGLVRQEAEAPAGWEVFHHPDAMMPRVVIRPGGSHGGVPEKVAIKPESVADFVAGHDLSSEIQGRFGSRLREAQVSEGGGTCLCAVERLAYHGFKIEDAEPEFAAAVHEVRERWRTRKRDFADDAEGVAHAFAVQRRAIARVGPDVACELFFAEERAFWELKNTAARVQKRRQDLLGLGWGNHDHHTFRCSRRFFSDLMRFLLNFGFRKRERYYAGAEAGWGAQISEHAATGITVFADVDLLPDETRLDFSTEALPEAPQLRTVGLWCGLHGDSFLQAGMHHLEARFDFSRLREQLAQSGIATMKAFSNFEFLKQAFTEGETWKVKPVRVQRLLERGLITPAQAESFLTEGAVGSHLENLQRRGGFKGFNQKSVSAIIAATDPRALRPAH
ncbi:MAG: hypothetical protein JOY92_11635 [Verrucomicrobia bacterium]|nr:hypothetical protein [Verrucomicrobiota bacterium]